MKVDYLIVGQGIAGSVMALTLEQRGNSVAILSKPELSSSSLIAAGVYNPFNFRRTTPVWKAKESLDALQQFYNFAEQKLQAQINNRIGFMSRQFGSAEERETWIEYAAKPGAAFAKTTMMEMKFTNLKTPFGIGTLLGSGTVNTKLLLERTRELYTNRGYYISEKCDHAKFHWENDSVTYDNRITADHVIFCEGHLARSNPFFDPKVVAPTKGELIHVHISQGPGNVNGAVYVIAQEKTDHFVCGATFNPGQDDEETTVEGRDELIRKLKTITDHEITVTAHFAGVRPAGRDRKPVLGRSRTNRNFSIFNGFGSKAVLYSPFLAQMLADHLENGTELAPEINVARFKVY